MVLTDCKLPSWLSHLLDDLTVRRPLLEFREIIVVCYFVYMMLLSMLVLGLSEKLRSHDGSRIFSLILELQSGLRETSSFSLLTSSKGVSEENLPLKFFL